jgi:hypothetical protein
LYWTFIFGFTPSLITLNGQSFMSACTVGSSNLRPIRRLDSVGNDLKSPYDYFPVRPHKMSSMHAVHIQFITHVVFLYTASPGAFQDLKPASAKNFTKLILTSAVGSASFSSHQNAFEICFLIGCLCVVGIVICQAEVSATRWPLVQRSLFDCVVSLCVIRKSIGRERQPTPCCRARNIILYYIILYYITLHSLHA